MCFAHVTTGDRTAESLSLLGDAQVQPLNVLHTHAGAQGKGDESMARVGAHPRVWRAALPHLATMPESETQALWSAIKESPPAKREELIRAIEQAR